MSRDLEILRHALGLDRYGRGVQYRNYFSTGPGTDDWDVCRRLVERGLMIDRGACQLYGGDHVFSVTHQGIEYARTSSQDELLEGSCK